MNRAHLWLLAFAIAPTWSLAAPCETLRPGWDGSPVSMANEAWGLFLSPIGLFLLAALVVAVAFRHAMGTALVVLLWSFFITALVVTQPESRALARAEGCIGSPALFIGLSAAICGAAVFYTFRRERRL